MSTLNRYWILEFTFDPLAARVRIALTAHPDEGTMDREIVVAEVVHFRAERYHDAAAACLGDFKGIAVVPDGRYWRYALDTGDATITFKSLQKIEL